MRKVRLIFSKTERARWLSHLDVMRVLQRAISRAGVPVAYSQGFNPHMKMSIALPCPVGVESLCEVCDIQLADDSYQLTELPLPDGFKLLGVIDLSVAVKDMKWFDYEIELERAVPFEDGSHVKTLKKRLSAQNPTEKPAKIAEEYSADAVWARRVRLLDGDGEFVAGSL